MVVDKNNIGDFEKCHQECVVVGFAKD